MDRFELRRQARMAMFSVPERLGLRFADGHIEMRAKPSGHGTDAFEWNGYATVYDADFPMWDQDGEAFTETVAPGAARRSLANPALDVPFLIGHNDAGVPLARTKSGTMTLREDSTGLLTHVPAMDGRREEVRALASAVERGDLDEMSLAFVVPPHGNKWDSAYEHRTITEMDLHRGDVSAVTHGANPATAGAWMRAVEQLSFRRPASIGGPVLLERRAMTAAQQSLAEQHGHPGQMCWDPDGDGDCDLTATGDTDHDYWSADGRQLKPVPGKPMERSEGRLLEILSSVTQAERDKAKAAGNSLPDGTYPINNAHQLHAAAILAASHHGDWKAAQELIRRRAKELGVDVTTLPGFGEEKADGRPLELRASAAEDVKAATAPDYDPGAAAHACPQCHAPADLDARYCDMCGASVTVDDSTGIPGDEQALSTARKLELRMRLQEMDELALQSA
jgi:HK97 family phage prohead protease